MLRNKKFISYGLLSSFMLPIVLTVPVVNAVPASDTNNQSTKIGSYESYESCVLNLSYVNNIDKLHTVIKSAGDKRTNKLNDLKGKIDSSVPAENKDTLVKSMNETIHSISVLQESSSKDRNSKHLQENYCHLLFDNQVFQFRINQINWMNSTSRRIKRDSNLLQVLNSKSNTDYKSRLKTDTDKRYNEARNIVNNNLATEKAAATQIAGASITKFKSNLVKPNFSELDTAYQNARKLKTEARVIRVGAASMPKGVKLELSGDVILKDPSNKVMTEHMSKVTQASFIIINKKNNESQSISVVRLSSDKPWLIAQ